MDIEFDASTLMMIFFILSLVISMWKIYPFLQTRTLADDDTTQASQEELSKIILKYYDGTSDNQNTRELLEKIKNDKDFDKEHFWRFNENKLNHILDKLNYDKK